MVFSTPTKKSSKNSFEGFLVSFQAGPEFLTEFNDFCAKVYNEHSCVVSIEEFQGYCLEKMIDRRVNFDPQLGSPTNFMYSCLLNELRRLNSKYSRMVNGEIDDDLNEESSYVSQGSYYLSNDQNLRLDFAVTEFQRLALLRGFVVDMNLILNHFFDRDISRQSPTVRVFSWFLNKGGRVPIYYES